MSVRLLVNAVCRFIFSKDLDLLEHDNGTKIDTVRSGGLIWLPNHFLPASTVSVTRDLIHRPSVNLYEEGLLKLDRLGVRGSSRFYRLPGIQFCPSCAIEKSKVVDINRKSTRHNDPSIKFHIVASNIRRPISTPDLKGGRWALGAACYKTANMLCFFMKSKTNANSSGKGFIVTIESLDFAIKRARIENDSVCLSAQFMQVYLDESIIMKRTVLYVYICSLHGSKDSR